MLILWVTILLTICKNGSLQLAHTSLSPCQISFPFTTGYVSAYLEQVPLGVGCTTNVLTSSGEEVHVIKLLSVGLGNNTTSSKLDVSLVIKATSGEKIPLIIILQGSQPIRWRIKVEGIRRAEKKHLFLVQQHSRLIFLDKNLYRRVKKLDALPLSSDDLVTWVQDKYGAVTSLTELRYGNHITLTVGHDDTLSTPDCVFHKNQFSLRARGTYEQPQLVSGCIVNSRKDLLSRVAYVIELEHVDVLPQVNSVVEVNLDILGGRRQVTHKDFWLVLKSPGQVTWKIHTRKLQGYADIVANSFVEMAGIRMHTVGVRTEDITDSGQDLIQWVEYYIGEVALYAKIPVANKVSFQLPVSDHGGTEEQNSKTAKQQPKMIMTAFIQPSHTRASLRRVMHQECNPGQMTISIDKKVTQLFGLEPSQLSLLYPFCSAQENKTHVYLQTSTAGCGTQEVLKGQKMIYKNTVIIHPSKSGYDVVEGSGTGEEDDWEEVSGSGSHDFVTDTYVDDEDFSHQSIKMEVECEPKLEKVSKTDGFMIVKDSIQGTLDTPVDFHIEIFKSSSFTVPILSFPNPVGKNDRIYVQASTTAEKPSELRVQIHNCWLSPSLDRPDALQYPLIRDGCKQDQTVNWHYMSSANTIFRRETKQVQRFSFDIRHYFEQSEDFIYAFIRCQLTVCSRDPQKSDIPACYDDPETYCEKQRGKPLPPIQRVVCGPLNLEETVYMSPNLSDNVPTVRVDNKNDESEADDKGDEDSSPQAGSSSSGSSNQSIIIEGLDSGTVIGIAFAAFIIGVLLMAALWFIHTHTGPLKHTLSSRGTSESSSETTPSSSAPISA
ncbi:hypothetical protein ScPMuIL_010903 [Solemya velum]